jgi:ABC-2 type transport system ATP-binding protein
MKMSAVLDIENLSVEYRSKDLGQKTKLVVKGLSLSVAQGEVFGFLGPSGAGKTTTMNVLLGFVNATRGLARIFGIDVRQSIARQRLGQASVARPGRSRERDRGNQIKNIGAESRRA